MNRRQLLPRLAAALGLSFSWAAGCGGASAADRVKAVASFSILGDMARQIGGDRIEVVTLVGPNGDAHVYQPTPTDAKHLSEAKILVVNGLGFEGWMSRLERSAGFKGLTVTASNGVAVQQMDAEEHGHAQGRGRTVADPHAWQSLANGKLYARNIRDGLIQADPDGAASYEANAARFIAAMDALDAQARARLGTIPPTRRKVITSHDAFGYFGAAYGVQFIAPQGVSTESEASAKDVARIIRQIKAETIPAVFLENVSDKRLAEQISRETGARIGGALFSDALSPPDGPAPTYLDMVRHNVETLAAALAL
jgi:zinc/manganese transport system substrate-binding protein